MDKCHNDIIDRIGRVLNDMTPKSELKIGEKVQIVSDPEKGPYFVSSKLDRKYVISQFINGDEFRIKRRFNREELQLV